ncbi:cyclic nucleotide-gated cation channel subunit a [Holotrichia oblita]|uniref:Cyclic nucleotide-gated cation channel subunit a n=1 Tax=Holotrichia oblita TaxID=644536 RepID=A0ACB9SVS1_HOLOL|nr:cyclic nucleotide-gated cation channel subunit a [Holotrichia oblita]
MAVVIVDYFLSSTIYVYDPPVYPFDWEFYVTLICDGIYIFDVTSSICLKIIAWAHPNMIEYPKHISLILIDVVLALPYSTGYCVFYKTVTTGIFLVLRLITWLRLYRLVYFFNCFENTTRRHRWVIFYVKFFLYLIIIEHFFACAWYALVNFTPTGIRIWSNSLTNLSHYPKPVAKWYLITSYFSTTILSHTGFGDLSPVNINERFLTTMITCSGFLIWSYYVSSLITLLLRSRYPRYKLQKQLSLILQYLNLITADKDLQKQCVKYYQAFWDKDNGVLTSKKIADLPTAIAIYMNQKSCSFILKYTIIFNNKPASFLRNVCLYIKHEFYLPGQNIYDEKKLKEKMIIVKTGVIDILSEEDNETPIVSLGPGTCLGEAALVMIGLPRKSLYHNYTTVSQVYFTAVYFVFQTMTGIGFGDIYAESGVEITIIILILLSGLAFYGYVMTDIISNSARRKHGLLAYESKFLHLISYMQQQKVDSQLSLRVQDSLQYKWNRTRNVNIYSLLTQMNSTLHEDVVLYLYEATLRHVPMFENADHSFLRVIAKELREEYFIEGDTVVRNNDIVQDIYIIHKGSVELSNAHNMIPVIMGIGGVFGNVFEKDKSLCGISVRALKNLDLLCLNVETFRKLLKRYELITELPRTLKIDLMTSIYGKLIKDSYIFCRTERDFIRQLCLQLQHRTYFPGDYIVRDGDVDSCMYFIHKGDVGPGCSKTTGTAFITASPSRILQVQILTDGQNVNETVHEVLHKEEVFGIVQGLFKEIPHHFSFRALTIVDIASLKLNEWEYLLDFFPKSKDIIYQRVEEIYYTI